MLPLSSQLSSQLAAPRQEQKGQKEHEGSANTQDCFTDGVNIRGQRERGASREDEEHNTSMNTCDESVA